MRCKALRARGGRCKRNAEEDSDWCYAHQDPTKRRTPRSELEPIKAATAVKDHAAWEACLRGWDPARTARETLDDNGEPVFGSRLAVVRALERWHKAVTGPDVEQQRHQHLERLNRIYAKQWEMVEDSDLTFTETATQLFGDLGDLAALDPDQTKEILALMHRRVQVRNQALRDARQTVVEMAKIAGTNVHRQTVEHEWSTDAPVPLASLTAEERRMLLEVFAEDAQRRAAAPIEAIEAEAR